MGGRVGGRFDGICGKKGGGWLRNRLENLLAYGGKWGDTGGRLGV